MKEGEIDKVKKYSALCWSKQPVTDEHLTELSNIKVRIVVFVNRSYVFSIYISLNKIFGAEYLCTHVVKPSHLGCLNSQVASNHHYIMFARGCCAIQKGFAI